MISIRMATFNNLAQLSYEMEDYAIMVTVLSLPHKGLSSIGKANGDEEVASIMNTQSANFS
jgi:hypothetical protein